MEGRWRGEGEGRREREEGEKAKERRDGERRRRKRRKKRDGRKGEMEIEHDCDTIFYQPCIVPVKERGWGWAIRESSQTATSYLVIQRRSGACGSPSPCAGRRCHSSVPCCNHCRSR